MTLVVVGVTVTLLITFTPMFVAWRRHKARVCGCVRSRRLAGPRTGSPWSRGPMADHLCDILDRVPAHAWRPA